MQQCGSGPPLRRGRVACVSMLLCVPPLAYGFKHKFLRVLDEGSAQVSGRLEPVDGGRQDHTAGALPIQLRLIHARGISPLSRSAWAALIRRRRVRIIMISLVPRCSCERL